MCITIMFIRIFIWGFYIFMWGSFVAYGAYIFMWGSFVAYGCFLLMCGSLGAYTFSHVAHTSEEDMRHLAEEDAACRNVWSS
jgi:hypothetical protein